MKTHYRIILKNLNRNKKRIRIQKSHKKKIKITIKRKTSKISLYKRKQNIYFSLKKRKILTKKYQIIKKLKIKRFLLNVR